MALADSVPGVSGGTIAFLLGFYDRFISSLDDLFRGKKEQKKHALKFLIQLGIGWMIGMGLAVLVLSHIFTSHIYAVSSAFIGLILFAIPLVLREEKNTLQGQGKWSFYVFVGIVAVVAISALRPTGDFGCSGILWLVYLFLGGMIAISAMVLPGISGSTLLLILGLYVPVISSVRGLMGLDFSVLPTLIVFGLGVCAGAVLVIRLLRFLMSRFRPQMIFLILGLMLGSLYSVVIGPTTLDVPQPAMTLESFDLLFFLLGGGVIAGLQVLKVSMEKRGLQDQ